MSWYSDGEKPDRCYLRLTGDDPEDYPEEKEEDGDEEMDKTMMLLPETVEEFMEQNKIVDTEQIYTNGAELVPIFRMKQWFISHPCEPPQWIPVEDGLPEEEGQYLVSCDSDFEIEVARFYIDDEDDEDDRWWDCYWNDPEDVVAWMPLPLPYKEGEQNG